MSLEIEKILDESLKKAKEAYNSIADYSIEIGVIASNNERKQPLVKDITNAELMFIHENGSPLRNIPSRPVLQYTLQDSIKTIVPETIDRIYEGCFRKNWNKDDVKQELEKMCIRIQSHAKKIIYRSNRLAPNKPGTIKAKGSDRPLLDTGQLARSITCRLILSSESNS